MWQRVQLCLFLAMVNTLAVHGQVFNAAHGNFSGLSGVVWNPATVAENRYALQIQLYGIEANATNNAYRYAGPWSPVHREGGLQLNPTTLTPIDDGRTKLFNVGLLMQGPGLLLRINDKNGLAFATRTRQAFQGNAVSPSLLSTSLAGLNTPARWSNSSFNLNAMALAEWNVTYGRVLLAQGAHFLKAGLSVKHLFGMGAAYLQGRDVDYEVLAQPPGNRGDSLLLVHHLQGAYGTANTAALHEVDLLTTAGWLTGRKAAGSGWGADVGFVYEYRPSAARYKYLEQNERSGAPAAKYLYRISAALTDVGTVHYGEGTAYNDFMLNQYRVSQEDASQFYATNFDNKLNDILPLQRLNRQDGFAAGLPTAINVDVDYHWRKNWYLNAALSQSVRARYAVGLRTFSYASLTPRWETRWVDVALPLSLANDYRQWAAGLVLRAGTFSIGSTNVIGLFTSSHPYGANLFLEASLLGIVRKTAKEKAGRMGR